MPRLRLILALAAKDWRLFASDRRAAALCFAVPVALASAFGLIFDHAGGDAGGRLPVLVAAAGDGPAAGRLVAALAASRHLAAEVVGPADVGRRVADRRPGVAVVVPADAHRLGGRGPDAPRVVVLHHPLCQAEARWAEGVVTGVLAERLAADHLGPLAVALEAAVEAAVSPPVRVAVVGLGGAGGFNSYAHSFCGMTLQYLLFWGMESGILLLRERQRSLWVRLRAAPVPLSAVLLGKAVSTAGVAVLQVLVTFAFGYLAFGVAVTGSAVGFAVLVAGVGGLAAATGLLVAAVGGTEARARSVSILVILGVSMLGGLWLPAFVLPGWARDLAVLLPTTWAMRGLDAVTWQGRGLADAAGPAAAVGGFAAAFLAVAVARLVTSEARRRRGLT